MQSLNTLLESITAELRELTVAVNRLQRDAVSRGDLTDLVQQTTWDLNMLRRSAVSKENLRSLGGQLATRADLHQVAETVCRRLAASRFENHQEHQELFRTLDEGAYGLRAEGRAEGLPRAEGQRPISLHERSATIDQASVVEIEEIGAVVVPRSKVTATG